MTMYGADVDQLRSLAAHLDRAADQLDAHRTVLGSAIQQTQWLGPDAERFRGEWQARHSARVAESARLIRDTAATVRRNADEQERTSAVDGGAAATSSITRTNAFSNSLSGAAASLAGFAGGALDGAAGLVQEIRDGKLPYGVKSWDAVSAATNAAEMLGAHVPLVGVAGDVMDGLTLADQIRHGAFDIFDGADAAATVLRKLPGGVPQWGAAAIDVTAYAAQQAMKADFSPEAVATVTDYALQHPAEALQSVGEAVQTVTRDLVEPELKKFGFLPFTAAVDASSYAVQEAMKADFSPETRTMVADYVVQHPAETFQSIGDSILTVGTKAVSWFK